MKKRTRYSVFYGPDDDIARFSDWKDACAFAREASRPGGAYKVGGGVVEIESIDGVVAEYLNGELTPEYADAETRHG